MSNIRKFLNKVNILKVLCIICVLLVELVVCVGMTRIYHNNGLLRYLISPEWGGKYVQVDNDTVYEYTFTSDFDMIRGFLYRIQAGADGWGEITSGEMTLQVSDVESGQVLRSVVVYCERISHVDYFIIDMGEILTGMSGKDIKLTITFTNILDDQVFILCGQGTDGATYPATKISPAGKDSIQSAMPVIYAFIMLATVWAMSMVMFSKPLKLERVYLGVGLFLGVAMSLIMPLMTAPDETTHSRAAYHVSNVLMGIDESSDDTLVMRADDANMSFADMNFSREYYIRYYDSFFDEVQDETLVDTGKSYNTTPHYLYLSMGLGITIGRLLDFGPIMTYMLGRWISLLCFVVVVVFAIKKIPFGKALVFVWACLPITLQQSMAFTYDGPILALCILIIAITLSLMYGEEELSKRKRIRDIVVLVLACTLLAPCKSFALLPVVVLPLMVVCKELHSRKDRIKEYVFEKKSRKNICIATVTVVGLGALFVVAWVLKTLYSGADGLGHKLFWTDAYAYPVGYYLKYPMELVKIFVNTLIEDGEHLVMEAFGSTLGWLNQPIPTSVVIAYMFLFVFAAMRRSSEKQLISWGSRAWMLVLFFGVCFLAMFGMLIAWTPSYSEYIEGCQGRYYLPAMVLFGVSLRTKNTSRGDNSDRLIVSLLPMLFLVMATFIFKYKVQ